MSIPISAGGLFLPGIRLHTPSGVARAEDLAAGDLLLTDAGPAPVAVARMASAALPSVAIAAGAFGEGHPAVPMRVALEHLVFLTEPGAAQGLLVPVAGLINGRSIVRVAEAPAEPWVQIGFDRHALVLADGLPLATARPEGAPLCARQLPPGPALFALRNRVARGEIGATLPAPPAPGPDSPAVALLADGRAIAAPPPEPGQPWRFTIPARTATLRLVSPVGRPDGRADSRRFGVAVTALLLDGIPLDLAGPAIGDGFHALEGDPARQGPHWRWTTGDARLALPPAPRPRRLEVRITDWHQALARDPA